MSGKHRVNGEGTIYHRADGRWGATISLPGGRRRTIYAKSGPEIRAKLKELLERRDQGLVVASPDQKIGSYLERWLEDVSRPSIRPRTYEAYRANLGRLLPLIGHLHLNRLAPAHIQDAYAQLLKAGSSPRTVRHSHTVLHNALRQAVLWGLIARNPTDAVSPPRAPRIEMRTLSHVEVRQLLEVATAKQDRFAGLWTLMCTTGVRVGEAVALRWEDLDITSGRLSIRRAIQRQVGRGLVIVEPKSNQSRRSVQLSQVALDALRRHRSRQASEQLAAGSEWQANGLIFAASTGRPLDPHNVYVSFQGALRRADLPHVRLHDLRHTAASLLLMQEVHPKLVQELLGHSSITLTLDTYSHVIPALHGEVARRMDELLGQADTSKGR